MIELETRQCRGHLCKNVFRALPGSPNHYCCLNCFIHTRESKKNKQGGWQLYRDAKKLINKETEQLMKELQDESSLFTPEL